MTHIMQPWSILIALQCVLVCGKIIEVPAVVTVPEATPEQVVASTPTLPVWQGGKESVGVVLGSTVLWESQVRSEGLTITLGVGGGNWFADPSAMVGTSNSLRHATAGLYLEVTSNLAAVVFPRSFGGMLDKSQARPFDVFKSTKDCPSPHPCRIDIIFPPAPKYSIPQGDEHLTITLGPSLLYSGMTTSGPFMVTIKDDAQRDDLQRSLSDILEVVVGGSAMFGSSTTSAMSASRHLLLLHMSCGAKHDALDHATNPAEYGIGRGENRYYLGGLISNLLLATIPVLVHVGLVFIQWQCKGLQQDEDTRKRAKLYEDRTEMRCCGGVTLTEFRQLQETVRYPHYSLLFPLFVFQGVATCGWRLLIAGSPSERALGVLSLIFYNMGGMLLTWWKLGKWDYRRMGAVYISTGPQSAIREYLLGPGEWVSSTKRRLVQTYGLLFECFAVNRTRFILIELTLIMVISFLGVIDLTGWTGCIVQFSVVSVLLLVFLVSCLWFRPWASSLDNHVNNTVTVLQFFTMILKGISFSLHDSSNGTYNAACTVLIIATLILIIKGVVDICLLIFDTCAGRRAGLQEAFEQGQTLFHGRQAYRKYFRSAPSDPDDKEGEDMIVNMAPRPASTYLKQYMPPAEDADDVEDYIERDPFLHTDDCLVESGFMLLSRKGALLPQCPACGRSSSAPPPKTNTNAGMPKMTKRVAFTTDHHGAGSSGVANDQPVRTLGDWNEYLSDEGASYYHNFVTGETSWLPPYDFTDRYEP